MHACIHHNNTIIAFPPCGRTRLPGNYPSNAQGVGKVYEPGERNDEQGSGAGGT